MSAPPHGRPSTTAHPRRDEGEGQGPSLSVSNVGVMPIPVFLVASVEPTANGGASLSDVLGVLAFFLSLIVATIGWRNYRESGGRVSVKMFPAYYRPFAGIASLHVGQTKNMSLATRPGGAVIEMAEVVIQNAGRTGVTVTGVSLKVAHGAAILGYAPPRTFTLNGFPGHETDGETYFRIDPYDQRTFLIDYWAVVDAAFKKNPELRDVHIFVEVTVAGHDRPCDSKKMGYWRIFRDHISALPSRASRRPRDAFLLAMLRSTSPDLSLMNSLDFIALEVERQLPYPVTMDETLTIIDELLKGVEGELVRAEWDEKLDRGGYIPIYPVARHLVNQATLYGENFHPKPAKKAAPIG